jgi:NAD(P)-dependent dehydrogenase (short-subunit alcohol dehydrogenase family)
VLTKTQKVVWVTGASSGLGRCIALQLANSGALVIASARNQQALDELADLNPNIRPLACDITDAATLAALGEKIATISPAIDQAILNAGNCEYLDFPNPDWSAVRRVMEVNFFGSVNCVEFVLPLLRASNAGRPHLVVVASQVTAAAFPRAEAYGASKAALQYFCDSLRLDLAPQKIDVSVVNPGFVDTPLTRKNDFQMPFLMDADEAARRIVARLESRPRGFSFPRRLSLLLGISKLAPALWQRIVTTDNKTPASQQPGN